jgi:hypothetical protein
MLARYGCMIVLACTCACAGPTLARDGTVVFPEGNGRGASVLTANGVEFHDRLDVPKPVNVRDPSEPWRAPIGFILPASGRFTATSRPTVAGTTGFAISLRPSDTRIPSWGGEVLIRIDILAPAAAGTARWGEDIVIVIDEGGPDTLALADVALAQLAGRDRVTIIDARGGKVIVPTMPASHRSMVIAALEKYLKRKPTAASDLAHAIEVAHGLLGKTTLRRIVLLSDRRKTEALSEPLTKALRDLLADHVAFVAIAASDSASKSVLDAVAREGGGTWNADGSIDARSWALREAVPASGKAAFKDVILTFAGTPAPSHVLEASGGDVRWRLDAGELALGDVRAGDERTEVVRVSVPAWVPAESFKFTVTAHFDDVANNGDRRDFSATLPCVYDDDIERIAKSRHGDVIAYASALATLKRLDAAFIGDGVDRAGGLTSVAKMHAQSMTLLARDMKDPAYKEQADLLNALLAATAE